MFTYTGEAEDGVEEQWGAEVCLMTDKIPNKKIGIEETKNRMVGCQVERDQAGCQLVRDGHLSPITDLDTVQTFVT